MSVHITSSKGEYRRKDSDHFQVEENGTLKIFERGDLVLAYAPGCWFGVELEVEEEVF